jgi:hypothetical protein
MSETEKPEKSSKPRVPRRSRQNRAQINWSVSAVSKKLASRFGNGVCREARAAAPFMAAVIETVCAEIFRESARASNGKRIALQHVLRAVEDDPALARGRRGAVIARCDAPIAA